MLQRVTLNVIQVFQRIFDAINPCIIIYEYINTFFSVLLSFIFIVVYGGVMIVFKKKMLCRIRKIFLFCWTNCSVLSRVYIPRICMSALYSFTAAFENVNTTRAIVYTHSERLSTKHHHEKVFKSCSFPKKKNIPKSNDSQLMCTYCG